MSESVWLPRYPVYVPSRHRSEWGRAFTARRLMSDKVPFHLVVEEDEVEQYAELVGKERLLVLPFRDQGLFQARNWIKDHATAAGHKRHWQLDDNVEVFRRIWQGKRIPVAAGMALRACEDFSDRYENVAISGLNYQMFAGAWTSVPYYLNVHVYSCTLVLNEIPYRWRIKYNDDTDICLQALSDGWCTLLLNAFSANKITTMITGGGNTDQLYRLDGRLRMAQDLAKLWPGIVRVDRRWGRPQHVVNWKAFRPKLRRQQLSLFDDETEPIKDYELKRRDDVAFDELPPIDEYGLDLQQQREVRAKRLVQMGLDFNERAQNH